MEALARTEYPHNILIAVENPNFDIAKFLPHDPISTAPLSVIARYRQSTRETLNFVYNHPNTSEADKAWLKERKPSGYFDN
jgi:hypothetical protein